MATDELWGAERYQGNTEPNWYTDLTDNSVAAADFKNANNVIYDRPNHPSASENLEATDRGWERVVSYTDSHGNARTKREVVVATRDLANTLSYGTKGSADVVGNKPNQHGGPQIVDIRWGDGNSSWTTTLANDTGADYKYVTGQHSGANVVVTFSEAVFLNETSGRATLNVTTTTTKGKNGVASLELFCTSGNGTNQLLFTNVCSSTGGLLAGDVLTLVDNKNTPAAYTGHELIKLNSAELHNVAAGKHPGRGDTLAAGTRKANISPYGVASSAGASDVQGHSSGLGAAAGRARVKSE